ncbi:hypothetical protein QFZ79_003949 [Arthrobacter sp. V4I6]|nr:hypothetical protein [Arthrobacter sp. V1I7]MDQ0855838.1 hypothetical protein [Arthrobacter sp. V4I6]
MRNSVNGKVPGVVGRQVLLDDRSANPIELLEPTLPEASPPSNQRSRRGGLILQPCFRKAASQGPSILRNG